MVDFKSLRDRLASSTPGPNAPAPPPPPAPPAPPREKYAGIEGVHASKDKAYIQPGHYLMRIVAVKDGFAQEKRMDFFSVTLECLYVYASEGNIGNRAGQGDIRWTVLDKPKTPYLANIKGFVTGATGFPEEQVTAAVLREITGDGQPLAGVVVELTARSKPTKTPGKDFTVISWRRPVSFAECRGIFTPEEIARFWPAGALDKLIAEEQGR